MSESKNTYLFLDDWRLPIDCAHYMYRRQVDCRIYHLDWVIVRSYGEFVKWINNNGLPKFISFDFDLCDVDDLKLVPNKSDWFDEVNQKEYNGLNCAEFLIKYCNDKNEKMPEFAIHSMNPDGAELIKDLLLRFLISKTHK